MQPKLRCFLSPSPPCPWLCSQKLRIWHGLLGGRMEETDLLISQGSVVSSSIFLFLDGESVAVIRCRGHRLCLLEVALPSMVLSRWRCDFPLLLSPSSRLLFQSPSEVLEVGYWKGLWRLPMVWGVHPFLVFKSVCGYILVP
ncbi:Uncharacterized protein Rs2_05331 [Raphanus sativus]|nr:Uncharacterized protein Rs2_05331 [Raphanus sativus]